MIKISCIYLLVVASVSCSNVGNSSNSRTGRIFRGENETDITHEPYVAQLLRHGNHVCGATIISEYWIITAAHCFKYSDGLSILTGTVHQANNRYGRSIKKIYIHKDYNDQSHNNDIALIQLKHRIELSRWEDAIAIAKDYTKPGQKVKVFGWGRTEQALSSPILKSVVVTVADKETCYKNYWYKYESITKNMFCAGRLGKDSCQGDSGGPAIVNRRLAGIVSFGFHCAEYYFPGVYTEVYAYRDWIYNISGIEVIY